VIDHLVTPSPARPKTNREKRWPAKMVFLTAGLLPSTTARRTEHVGMASAYVVHVLAGLATAGAVVFLVAWSEAGSPVSLAGVLSELEQVVGSVGREINAVSLVIAAITVLGVIIVIEAAYLLLAALVMPWGACDEPIHASLNSAIRRTWLHTPHALLVVLLVGCFTVPLNRARRECIKEIHNELQPLIDSSMGPQQWQEYSRARSEAWGRYPFYLRYAEQITAISCFACVGWWLWALLRGVGAPRRTQPIARPPMCEMCGYNLTSILMEGRCPECGEPAVCSLGPDVRRGTVWQRRRDLGRLQTYWRCAKDAVIRPVWLGRQLPVSRRVTDHRMFFALHLPVIFVIAWSGIIGAYVAETGRNPFARDAEIVWFVAPFAGFFSVAVALLLTATAAGLIAVANRKKVKRNLMAGSVQAACYLSGTLTMWVALSVILFVLNFAAKDYLHGIAVMISVDRDSVQFLAWVLPNLLCLVLYYWLVGRITSGTRYANR